MLVRDLLKVFRRIEEGLTVIVEGGKMNTKKGDGALCRLTLEPRQRLSRHSRGAHPFAREQVNFLAAVALVMVNIRLGRKNHPLAQMAFLGPQVWLKRWSQSGNPGERATLPLPRDGRGLEELASLTNRDVSAFRNRVHFERGFLALMQAQRRPHQTQHEPPVKPHPCFLNRCRSKGGKDFRHPSQAIG